MGRIVTELRSATPGAAGELGSLAVLSCSDKDRFLIACRTADPSAVDTKEQAGFELLEAMTDYFCRIAHARVRALGHQSVITRHRSHTRSAAERA
ncbi:MAG TPA: hypothetical protein VMH22_12565 [bacterium]|nr:hypothetical protein [bacterium]